MRPRISDCMVIVFAKAPRAGAAKTRLISALGTDGAARLAEQLLRHTLEQACVAALGPVQLCVTPDTDLAHPAFRAAEARHPSITLAPQGDGNLGARMARALQRALQDHAHALLIGTDIPALDATYLHAAARALQDGADAVFGPAADGGYTLVGLSQPAPGLFSGMQWSHAQVMAHTRQCIAALGLRHVELPVLHDVDEPADLIHLPSCWLATLPAVTTESPSMEPR